MAAVTVPSDFGAQENKACHCFIFFLTSICHEVVEPDAMNPGFWMLNLKPAFSLSSFTFIKSLFSPSCLSAIGSIVATILDLAQSSSSLFSEV